MPYEENCQHPTETKIAAELGAALANMESIKDRIDLIALPNGFNLKDLEAYLPFPRRIRATPQLSDLKSLDSYLKRYDDDATTIFFDRNARTIRAILDSHGKNEPSHCDHKVTVQLRFSREWIDWTGADDKKVSQVEFAEFIEQHIDHIVEPAGAALLESVLHIQSNRNVKFSRKVNLDNGDLVFGYESDSKGKGDVVLPERIIIGIPVLHRGELYEVKSRLRYRISDEGELSIWYVITNLDAVREDALDSVQAQLGGMVGESNVYEGTP